MFDAKTIKAATKIANLADGGGIIQADKAVRLFPGRPTLHRTMDVREAWRLTFGNDVDLDALSEALWG